MKKNRLFVLFFGFIVAFMLLGGFDFTISTQATQKAYCYATEEDSFAEDAVLVVLTKEASRNALSYSVDDFQSIDCTKVVHMCEPDNDADYQHVMCLAIANGTKQKVLNAVNSLIERDDVYYAGPDYYYEEASTEELDDVYQDGLWGYDAINLDAAWDITTGNSQNPVRVAVIDTGIDYRHEYLRDNLDVTAGRYIHDAEDIYAEEYLMA